MYKQNIEYDSKLKTSCATATLLMRNLFENFQVHIFVSMADFTARAKRSDTHEPLFLKLRLVNIPSFIEFLKSENRSLQFDTDSNVAIPCHVRRYVHPKFY